MGPGRASKSMAVLCTASGLVLILGISVEIVNYAVEGYIPSGFMEVLLLGVVMFLIGLVLFRLCIKRGW